MHKRPKRTPPPEPTQPKTVDLGISGFKLGSAKIQDHHRQRVEKIAVENLKHLIAKVKRGESQIVNYNGNRLESGEIELEIVFKNKDD